MAGSIVQAVMAFSAGASSISIAFAVNNTSGNDLGAFANAGTGSSENLSFTDSNNTYGSNIDTINDASHGNTCASNKIISCAGGANTVKGTDSSGAGLTAVIAVEMTGVSALDGHNATNNTSGSTSTDAMVSGTASNASTAFMLAADFCLHDGNTLASAGTGFTSSNGTNITASGGAASGIASRIEWKASVAAGSNQATFTNTVSGNTHGVLMMMFDETGGGGAPTVHPLMALGMGS